MGFFSRVETLTNRFLAPEIVDSPPFEQNPSTRFKNKIHKHTIARSSALDRFTQAITIPTDSAVISVCSSDKTGCVFYNLVLMKCVDVYLQTL